jgi:hypothetical protein
MTTQKIAVFMPDDMPTAPLNTVIERSPDVVKAALRQ